MVGGVKQLHGTGVEDIGFGCTKSHSDDGRTLVKIRSSINIDITRSIVGQMNERVELNGLGHSPGVISIARRRKTIYQRIIGQHLWGQEDYPLQLD